MIGKLLQAEFGPPASWPAMLGLVLVWLAAMYAYSPVADRLASRLASKPPTLSAFRPLQQSLVKLLLGILMAWLAGGFVEEIALRGILLRWVEWTSAPSLSATVSTGLAICAAALLGGALHLYQGLRGAIIIAQLSLLFGVLFVVSGYTLWSVILCHGLYDTIAFMRFAAGASKYSKIAGN